MAPGRLLKFKRETQKEKKELYRQHVVVGEDLFSLCLYEKLKNKFGLEQVALLSEYPVARTDIYPLGPSTLRGRKNVEKIECLFPDLELQRKEASPLFYKELKWRDFCGRIKPQKLLWNEKFFTQPRVEFDLEALYPFLREEEFFVSINKERLDLSLIGFCREEPRDLLEPRYFSLDCADGTRVGCEFLYWARSSQAFLKSYQDKGQLSEKFVQFCKETCSPSALYIRFDFDQAITDKFETLFIPLSYTHDWGHFVGEFRDRGESGQRAEFVTYLDADQSSEEEVSRKIRLLKRNLNKIFKNFSKIPFKEFIKLSEDSACLKIDDRLFQRVRGELPNFQMVSFNAPIENNDLDKAEGQDGLEGLSFFARGAVCLNEIELRL